MPTKLIVVTGVQGGSVARLFAQDPNWRVWGITRHPDRLSNASLREAGIELVVGEYDDVASLDRAFNGANAIFGATGFLYGLNLYFCAYRLLTVLSSMEGSAGDRRS